MNNRLITVLIMVCSTALWALPPVGASLPMTVHEDSETSTNVAFVAVQDRMGSFGFSLSCMATASNNVQVAFGAANGEVGDFSIDDAECVVGWDCGAWFVQNGADGTRVEMPSSTTNEQKTLVWNLSCRPLRLSVSEEGGSGLFTEFLEDIPAWAYDPAWNRMRLTGRGVGALREQFRIQVLPDSVAIYFR